MKQILCAVAVVILLGSTRAEEKPLTEEQKKRVEELKKQIADKKAEVAKLEAELAEFDPVEKVDYLYASNLKVGTAGRFGAGFTQNGRNLGPSLVEIFNVVKVVDDKRAIVKSLVLSEVQKGVATHTYGEFMLIGPTKGLADGGTLKSELRSYRVTGTEKHNDKTYFTVEPHIAPKK